MNNNTEVPIRQLANQWWENTVKDAAERVEWKFKLCRKYYGDRDYTSLTGREIEVIYLSQNGIAPNTEVKQDAISLHTKGEWVLDNSDGMPQVWNCEVSEVSVPGQWIAYVRGDNDDTRKANAARIVKCVNAHDELVKALHNCIETMEAINHLQGGKLFPQTLQEAKEALKKANQ